MATSQRVSRGFHRLALFLAAIPLLAGALFIGDFVWNAFTSAQDTYSKMAGTACAKAKLAAMSELPPPQQDLTDNLPSYAKPALSDYLKSYDLQQLGCSDVSRLVSKFEIMTAGVPGSFWGYLFSDISFLLKFVGTIIAIALAAALAVYVIVRAIGWVIGGFVA